MNKLGAILSCDIPCWENINVGDSSIKNIFKHTYAINKLFSRGIITDNAKNYNLNFPVQQINLSIIMNIDDGDEYCGMKIF